MRSFSDTLPNMSRRRFQTLIAALPVLSLPVARAEASVNSESVRIHRFEQTKPFPVNAYVVEGAEGLALIDGTLTNSASQDLKQQIQSLNKPLKGILLTHPHPDHYAGIVNVIDDRQLPIYSVAGVDRIVRRDDEIKDQLIGSMFGDEWPSSRRFPTEIVTENDTITLDTDLVFDVLDIGPAESFHDSVFLLRGSTPTAFVGDLTYTWMHAYMADNHNPEWQNALDRLRSELAENTVMYVGHGEPVTPAYIHWQKEYLATFDKVIESVDFSSPEAGTASVVERMSEHLPDKRLEFLMQISVQPNATRLGKIKG